MWPVLVVVPDVLGERLFQVTTPEDQDPVQALSPYGPAAKFLASSVTKALLG
jgi:hypothetical protein